MCGNKKFIILINKQLYDLIFARSVYKQSFLPTVNFEPFILDGNILYYTSDPAIQNAYPAPVQYPPYIPNTKEAKTTWNAVTDTQTNLVGSINVYGTTLINPFNI